MEEEVDLREYINVMLKWKWLIIWITILAMAFAGILSYFVIRPVYEGTAVMVPAVFFSDLFGSNNNDYKGSLDNFYYVISPNELSVEISNENFLREIRNADNSLISLSAAPIKSTKLVKITLDSLNRSNISHYFDKILMLVKEYNSQAYYKQINIVKEYQSDTERSIVTLQKREELINKEIKSDNLNPTAYILALQTLNDIETEKKNLNQKMINIDRCLTLSHDFYYLDKPVVPTRPVKPKKMFNIAVAGVAAFFFAILLAFFLEYWQSGDDKSKLAESSK